MWIFNYNKRQSYCPLVVCNQYSNALTPVFESLYNMINPPRSHLLAGCKLVLLNTVVSDTVFYLFYFSLFPLNPLGLLHSGLKANIGFQWGWERQAELSHLPGRLISGLPTLYRMPPLLPGFPGYSSWKTGLLHVELIFGNFVQILEIIKNLWIWFYCWLFRYHFIFWVYANSNGNCLFNKSFLVLKFVAKNDLYIYKYFIQIDHFFY